MSKKARRNKSKRSARTGTPRPTSPSGSAAATAGDRPAPAQTAGADAGLSAQTARAMSQALEGFPGPRPPSLPAAAGSPGPMSAGTASAGPARPTATALTVKEQPTPTAAVDVTAWTCASLDDTQPQALGMTYWLEPTSVTHARMAVRFAGQRVGASCPPAPGDRFVTEVKVGALPAGTGRVAVTGRAQGITAGEWQVSAEALMDRAVTGGIARGGAGGPARGIGHTGFAPVIRVRAPGVHVYAWPGFVLFGTAVALLVQFLLARAQDLPAGRLLAVTGLACVIGTAGAKAYYILTHRNGGLRLRGTGMSVQGFVLASISTLALGAALTGVPVGPALDVTTPGLLFGMTVGRFGCFFGGCCAGRPTRSRWGLWSSDRTLGVRRIPVQLVESATAAVLAAAAAALLLTQEGPGGAVFVAGMAAYTLARQLLFPLRQIARSTRYGRPVTAALCALAVLGAVLATVLS